MGLGGLTILGFDWIDGIALVAVVIFSVIGVLGLWFPAILDIELDLFIPAITLAIFSSNDSPDMILSII